MTDNRISVSIITGFLGAGKTTLLNHLRKQYPQKKLAIIENEIGEINIDSELVIGVEDGIFEMSDGCICCELNDELVDVLVKILNNHSDIDHLIIETTGIAEPDSIAAIFVTDPEVQQYFRLDATVCLVDSCHVLDMVEEREEARKQITFADYIIINKISEISEDYLKELKVEIKKMNQVAEIETVDYSQTNRDVLNLRAFDLEKVEKSITKAAENDHHHHDHTCDEHCHHHHEHQHTHRSDITTHSFVIDEALDFLKFRHWINILLTFQSERIYRVKGILNFQYKEEKMILQSVRNMFAFQVGNHWAEEKRQSKIVFIGKGVKREALEKSLQSCLFTETYFE